ncbi:SDR family NAD(P)-dependent oxidoreductase [Macrococcus equipercicus]|uniref:Diacetyl reductase [(S)-acetoin forming] n=1 Tax=Macrococcus equipercicus TaxID=69967 RepID=A0A9Q9BRA3_9STAP|nr:SDR family oxidoreductase [Macrococcus equipercicus]KAA1042367.1 SDR family oxidoreductase [Macrococcus equipercicus]UTH14251.1 SDR family oxidoreductase [Macrococcus equipercicus]
MDLKLAGKVAVITGSSKGIGRETAAVLTEEGAVVILTARNEESLQDAVQYIKDRTGRTVDYVTADVTNEADAKKVIAFAAEKYGHLDILINNAGSAFAENFENVSLDDWQNDLNLKLFGWIHMIHAALPELKKQGGAILNLTAVAGKTPPANTSPTSVSRAAGLALTNTLSKDLAPYNIRVNAVCIGLIRSGQIERRWQAEAPEQSWEDYARDPKFNIPLGRIGDTREAANVISFLVSDAASYVTGTAVNIDGGSAPSL